MLLVTASVIASLLTDPSSQPQSEPRFDVIQASLEITSERFTTQLDSLSDRIDAIAEDSTVPADARMAQIELLIHQSEPLIAGYAAEVRDNFERQAALRDDPARASEDRGYGEALQRYVLGLPGELRRGAALTIAANGG
ncbi:MAG: hypothetical protein K2X61_00800 [Caulobacteraceae bacterium]|nr:hypothetical protein [Caulobacteraceae bacterium]